jgi:GH25 family lysozyme M1 (1,4-beta-N-acetylmuramidase)
MKQYVRPTKRAGSVKKRGGWLGLSSETFRNVSLGVAGVVSSVMIPIVGLALSKQDRDRELSRQYVALGIDILQKAPKGEDDPVRDWAIQLVNKYSDVPLSAEAQKALSQEPIFATPVGPVITTEALQKLATTGFARGVILHRKVGSVDFAALQREGVRFVYIKASQGAGKPTPDLGRAVAAAHKAGLRVGLYHYFLPSSAVVEQVSAFLVAAGSVDDDLPPVLACETEAPQSTNAEYAGHVRQFLDRVEAALGAVPVIYASRGFATVHFRTGFDRYPLFLADYRKGNDMPKAPQGWKSVTFWHAAEGAEGGGASGNFDVVLFKGDVAKLPAPRR